MAISNSFFNDYSGGINQNVSRLMMADNELNYLSNGELSKAGAVQKVRGYLARGSAVNSGYDILGMCSAYKSDGTTKQIAVADGLASSDAYTYNPITSAWTPHILSLTASAKCEFEYFLDGFFLVNFSDATRWNNFVSWSTTTNVTNAAKARYIKLYNSRIYLAYVVSGGTTYTSRITYSDLPAGSPMTIAWDDSVNYFDVDQDDGDVIKGMEVNANRLLVFKENKLFRYDTNSLYQVPGCPGTISQRSVRNLQGWTLYLHPTGIWGYNGTGSQILSRKINDLILGISTQNFANACAHIKGDHYYLYVGDVNNSRAGLTITKCLIDYDIAKNAFCWRSLDVEPTVFIEYRDDRSTLTYDDATVTYNDANITYNAITTAEKRVYFGTTAGYVYEFDRGNSYNGNAIPFSMETRDYYLTAPSNFKLLRKLIMYVNSGKGLMVQFRMDDKDWRTLGRVDKTQTELSFPQGCRCQRVRLRFLEMSSGGQYYVEGHDLYYDIESEIE